MSFTGFNFNNYLSQQNTTGQTNTLAQQNMLGQTNTLVQPNNFSFQNQQTSSEITDDLYILYKTTDKGRINVGYFKDGKEVIKHFSNNQYSINTESIKWFEIDKFTLSTKNMETFILAHNGYLSKMDNKFYNYPIQQPDYYTNLMIKTEYKRVFLEINEVNNKINKKLQNSYLITGTKCNEYQEILNKLEIFEKNL